MYVGIGNCEVDRWGKKSPTERTILIMMRLFTQNNIFIMKQESEIYILMYM